MTVPYLPSWQNPSAPGQLSNSSTPALKARYLNPNAQGDKVGQARFIATRLATAAAPTSPPFLLWDSGWLGQPTITSPPRALRDYGCAVWGNRVYFCGGVDASGAARGDVWSSPIGGGSLGTWRSEKPMAVRVNTSSGSALVTRYGHGCCAATFGGSVTGTADPNQKGKGGIPWLIVYGGFEKYVNGAATKASSTLLAAPILGDGVLGDWVTLSFSGWAPLAYCQLLPVPNQYNTTALILSGGVQTNGGVAVPSAWSTVIRNAPVTAQTASDWDAPLGWWTSLPNHVALAGHCLAFDWANGTLLAFKGSDDSTGSQTGFYYCSYSVDNSLWTQSIGGSWSAGSAADGTQAQNNAAIIYFGAQEPGSLGGSPTSWVYLLGGNAGTAVASAANAINVVAFTSLTWNASNQPTAAAWTHSAQVLPQGSAGIRAFLHDHGEQTLFGYPPWMDPNKTYFTAMGGGNGTNIAVANTETTSLPALAGAGAWTTSGGDIAAWQGIGAGAGLQASDLGTGGTLTTNSDGSQDMGITYGQVTTATATVNGDQVQVQVQTRDVAGGDPSPVSYNLLKIGQAPTVSNLAVSSTATGQPVVSFNYAAGAGGAGQATWQVKVTRNSDSAVMFDSGVRYDISNSIQCVCAPMLANAVAYTVTVTVTSLDAPQSGSTNSATGTLSLTPALAAAPTAPSGVSATNSDANGWIQLSWTNATGTVANRLYYRVSGTTPWTLLVDNYTAGAGAQSVKLMDRIPLATSLDFCVSALGSSSSVESAQSSVASATISPAAGGYSSFLHVAGQALTGATGVALLVDGSPTLSATYASKAAPVFGRAHPVQRQGLLNYRTLQLKHFSSSAANLRSLEAVVDQGLNGGTLYYRDALGAIWTCAITSPEDLAYEVPNYRIATLRLIQVADTNAPYVTAGSAQGIPTLVSGSLPPLDRINLAA